MAQHNAAFAAWQRAHGDDPDAVAALLQEHAQIVASENIGSKTTDIPKRVASISQQMADMASPIHAVTPAIADLSSSLILTSWRTTLLL